MILQQQVESFSRSKLREEDYVWYDYTNNMDRYLTVDDDRHGDGPDEVDSTNNPTIFGYTRTPSFQPTFTPTSKPTSIPSEGMSFIPSDSPSEHPSDFPSLDLCKSYDGEFGDTTGENIIPLLFHYGVESNKIVSATMKATISGQVREVEKSMLDLLITALIPDCNVTDNAYMETKDPINNMLLSQAHNIFIGTGMRIYQDDPLSNEGSARSDSAKTQIIGMSSSPIDLANGRKCVGKYRGSDDIAPDCNVIVGKLTIFLSSMEGVTGFTKILLKTLKDLMDDNLLDSCHPAILSVMFLASDEDQEIVKLLKQDDALRLSWVDQYIWSMIASTIVLFTIVVTVTRYRFYRREEYDEIKQLFPHKTRREFSVSSKFAE